MSNKALKDCFKNICLYCNFWLPISPVSGCQLLHLKMFLKSTSCRQSVTSELRNHATSFTRRFFSWQFLPVLFQTFCGHTLKYVRKRFMHRRIWMHFLSLYMMSCVSGSAPFMPMTPIHHHFFVDVWHIPPPSSFVFFSSALALLTWIYFKAKLAFDWNAFLRNKIWPPHNLVSNFTWMLHGLS